MPMPEMPLWALALNYWLHLLATITWLGGLVMLTVMARRLPPEAQTWLDALEKRFRPLVNASMAILLITGFFQSSADPNYGGLLVIDSTWALALFAKHILFVGMVGISLALQMTVLPELDRARLLRDETAIGAQRGRIRTMTTINLVLGVGVLALTAVMTAV
ncbi:MAG: hypothetical protein GYB64_17190 [Chloroflexi bacterium]|nr:hypothetical protein [Chloroflexota bacterium]